MADRWNILVELSMGDERGPVAQFYVPVDDEDDLPTIDARSERAEAAALDALRPFLNNRTHFIASTYLPLDTPVRAASPSETDHRERE